MALRIIRNIWSISALGVLLLLGPYDVKREQALIQELHPKDIGTVFVNNLQEDRTYRELFNVSYMFPMTSLMRIGSA